MLFGKRRREENQYYIEALQGIKNELLSLGQLYEKASRQPVQKHIKKLCISTDKILRELMDNRKLIHKLGTFSGYYLPETVGIVRQYVKIKQNSAPGAQEQELIEKIEAFMPFAEKAFDDVLQSLTLPEARGCGTDIDVLIEELGRFAR